MPDNYTVFKWLKAIVLALQNRFQAIHEVAVALVQEPALESSRSQEVEDDL